MSQIYIQSSAQFQGVIDELTGMRNEFISKASAIDTEQLNLTSKWQGDASTAMLNHWIKERDNFQTLADVLQQYIEGLQQILANYETAEARNQQIAEN